MKLSELTAVELAALMRQFNVWFLCNVPQAELLTKEIRETYWQAFAAGYQLGKEAR